ncbi:histidine phosphatase family protein [Paenibacillus sp. P25]|nr:histidine phosphatase family protein [Paenibacillus sp. P25]
MRSGRTAPEAALTELGWDQAEDLPAFFANIPLDGVITSSYLRAQLTAEPLARAFGLPVRVDDRLVERVLSSEPLPHWRECLRQTYEDENLRFPGGETSEEAASRGMACLKEQALSGLKHMAVVTHGNLLSLLLKRISGQFGYEAWSKLTNPDVYHVSYFEDKWMYRGRIWRGDAEAPPAKRLIRAAQPGRDQ